MARILLILWIFVIFFLLLRWVVRRRLKIWSSLNFYRKDNFTNSLSESFSIPDKTFFISEAKLVFNIFACDYGYQFIDEYIGEWSVNIKYYNSSLNRTIEIKNETHPVDYGFSLFINDHNTNEYNIIANIPWSKEDKDCYFLRRVANVLSAGPAIKQIIGGDWKKLDRIYFQE
jgi:hypothetical protein